MHGDVLRFCRAELLEDNYFDAFLEATKSVAQQVRDRSGLTTDGSSLYQTAFGGDSPSVRVNAMRTKSERGEQRGFMNLLIGMAGVFRNTAAHEAPIMWAMPVEDALDLFALTSYAHRRIDRATTLDTVCRRARWQDTREAPRQHASRTTWASRDRPCARAARGFTRGA